MKKNNIIIAIGIIFLSGIMFFLGCLYGQRIEREGNEFSKNLREESNKEKMEFIYLLGTVSGIKYTNSGYDRNVFETHLSETKEKFFK